MIKKELLLEIHEALKPVLQRVQTSPTDLTDFIENVAFYLGGNIGLAFKENAPIATVAVVDIVAQAVESAVKS